MTESTATDVRAWLDANGVTGETRTLSETVATADDAAAALGCELGAIAKSLVFDEGGAPLLVLTSGAHKVDTKKLARRLGTGKIRRATPEYVREHTGQQVGGVAAVGHPEKIRTVVDEALAGYPVVWAGGGDENTMFATSFEELVRITDGTVSTVT
jgi:prolyl-tRNA editing enzyme YbaK/EbsC (Cys-tRNA(Pro) deacylase)